MCEFSREAQATGVRIIEGMGIDAEALNAFPTRRSFIVIAILSNRLVHK